MASSLKKVGGFTGSALDKGCGVLEPKAIQVTKGVVEEDGHLEFLEINMLLFISHLC